MSRFSALKREQSERIATIVAITRGETPPAPRLASTRPVAAAPSPRPPVATARPSAVERSPEYRAAYDQAFAKRSAETVATINTVRACKFFPGRERLALSMIGGGATAAQVVEALAVCRTVAPTAAEAAADKRAATDAIWERAYGNVTPQAAKILDAQRKASGGPVAKKAAASDAVWERAQAKLTPQATAILAAQRGGAAR